MEFEFRLSTIFRDQIPVSGWSISDVARLTEIDRQNFSLVINSLGGASAKVFASSIVLNITCV